MKDMLEDCNGGILVDPMRPKEIASSIIKLLNNKELRFNLAKNARKKVLNSYNADCIGRLLEKHYSSAIKSV